jgi:diguanylate cyclase (GGDEF)-like protein
VAATTPRHPCDGPVVDDAVLRDPARLRALAATGVVGTPDDERLDRWARLALEATGAGAAVLSLLGDEEAYFKAFQVAGGGAGDGRVVPVTFTLCREVVVRAGEFIVHDAPGDPRCAGYAGVSAFPVGAYAGVPVRSSDGHVLGSFCVVDPHPRSFSPAELAGLRQAAAAAETELQRLAALGRAARADALMDAQHRAHELLAAGAPLSEVLDALVLGVQAQGRRVRGSVLLLTEDGTHLRHASAPDMPEGWQRLVDGLPVDPEIGSCCAAAALGRPVFSDDVTTDPRWRAFRAEARAAGVAACWSVPIRGTTGEVLGTFALYAERPGAPSPEEADLLDRAARLASIALELDGARRRLVALADTDPLTRLPNRGNLLRRLQARLDRAHAGAPVAVLFVDLDRFKLINDSLGHATGDAVLAAVARCLEGTLRPDDLIGRLGGDEFVVVPAGVQHEAGARAVAARLREALGRPVRDAAGGQHTVRASIGIALAEGGSALEAIRQADSAMYVAKRGRQPVALHDAGVDARRAAELQVVEALQGALERGELRLVYQPVVDLERERVHAFEALLRWSHPVLGDVSPATFVPIAEEHRLIGPIGAWVLERALRDAARWNRTGRRLLIAVNLSCEQLVDERVADNVLRACAAAGHDPGLLAVEVTETAVLVDDGAARRALSALREAGVVVALDDFGTGFSSLTHLRSLPIDAVKLDRSFTAELGTKEGDALARGVLALAAGLGHQVVAEGVETAAQAAFLAAAGCRRAQGWHFGRPVEVGVVDAWVAGGATGWTTGPLALAA